MSAAKSIGQSSEGCATECHGHGRNQIRAVRYTGNGVRQRQADNSLPHTSSCQRRNLSDSRQRVAPPNAMDTGEIRSELLDILVTEFGNDKRTTLCRTRLHVSGEIYRTVVRGLRHRMPWKREKSDPSC